VHKTQPRKWECSPAGGHQTRICRKADPLTLIRKWSRPADLRLRRSRALLVAPGMTVNRCA
jgi:hypothetical protein